MTTDKLRQQAHAIRLAIIQRTHADIIERTQARLKRIEELLPVSEQYAIKPLVDERRSLLRQLKEMDGTVDGVFPD